MTDKNMNVKAIIEFAGIVSVIASLIFVGLEVQQSSAVARAQSAQAVADSVSNVVALAVQDPELGALIIAVNSNQLPLSELDSEQFARLYFFNWMTLRSIQAFYTSIQSGILPADALNLAEGNAINPFVRAYWGILSPNLETEFVEYVESLEVL